MKKFFFIFLSIVLGCVFLFSGYSKLFPIEPFEFNFVHIGIANWITAPIFSRSFIALEFFLGMLLILNFKLRQFTLKATFFILLFFTSYLIYQIIKEGNSGNCGCFGEMLKMTPLQSIYKNLILIGLVLILYFSKHNVEWRWKNEVYFVAVIICISTTMLLNPFDYNASKIIKDEISNLPLPVDTLYTSANAFPKPIVNLKKGKYIVCFLSLKCQHCLDAAFKMNIIKQQMPEAPFYFIFGGVKQDLQYFLDKSKHKQIEYTLFEDNYFFTMCGGQYPGIYYTEDGIIKRKGNIYTLDAANIKLWLDKK
jgi:uncharacterized membrane protein YphA (DoxX/SURF4 family)